MALLVALIKQKSNLTQQEIVEYLHQETGLVCHRSTIARTLKRNDITYKKLTPSYSEQNPKRVQKFIQETKPLLAETPFLAMDETAFFLNENPRYGYSPKGTRAYTRKPGRKGIHVTLSLGVANIPKNAIVGYQLVIGAANTQSFYEFLEELPDGEKCYLLLDNATIHHAYYTRIQAGLPSIPDQLAIKNIEP